LKIIATPASLEPGPFVRFVLALTGANVLSGVGGAKVAPVLGGELVEVEKLLLLLDDLRDGLGLLRPELARKHFDGAGGLGLVLGTGDLMDGALRPPMDALGQRVEHVPALMDPISLMSAPGKTSFAAAQKPKAPSPTASAGALMPCF
jgi:hypothetical protein